MTTLSCPTFYSPHFLLMNSLPALDSFLPMINLQLEMLVLLAAGWILGRKTSIFSDEGKQLTSLIMNLILPASIIHSFQMKMTSQILHNTLSILLISCLIQLILILLSRMMWNHFEYSQRVNLQYGTFASNAGIMGMVVCQAAFGEAGLLYAAVFMIPMRVVMWSYGTLIYGNRAVSIKNLICRTLMHPCLIAIAAGLILMILESSFSLTLPVFIQDGLNALAGCNTALCMLLIGVVLCRQRADAFLEKRVWVYTLIRLIALPALIMLLLMPFHLSPMVFGICVLETAMPAPSTMVMLARENDCNAQFASRLVFLSTLLSLITLPLWTILFQLI